MLINGIKFACNTCIKGHRSSSCNHVERPLFEIRKKGRPVTQCAYCRDLRKTKQIHIKCSCTDKSKNQCYQCPSKQQQQPYPALGEDHGISYNDIILSSSLSNQDQSSMQCTCHETAKTLLLSGNPNGHHSSQAAANTPGAPPPPISEAKGKEFAWLSPESSSRTRNSFDDSNYYALQRSHSSSLRFLEGQTKSPRRRSSITRKYSCKRTSAIASTQSDSGSSSSISSNSHIIENNINNNNGHFVLNQNCATIPPSATSHTMMSDYSENENAMFIDMQSFDYGVLPHHLITEADPVAAMPVTNNNCYIPCSASSMTSTPTVLSSSIEEKSSMMMYEDFHLTNTDPDELTTLLNNVLNDEHSPRWTTTTSSSSRSSVDMTRTTSSSSGILAPPRATTTTVCGSLTPHTNCCPPIDTQGQSVVITITPLLCKDVKSQPMTTKIVTCYCGSACHCPGCFVHPDNNQLLYPSFHPSTASSTSSSYSSDDEEHLLYA